MNIRDVLAERDDKSVKTISPHQTLREAARSMMAHSVGSLAVIDADGKLSGIITERDLLRASAEDGAYLIDKTVAAAMTRKVTTCTPDNQVDEIFSKMKAGRFRHIPVLDEGKLSGIISIRDLTLAYELLMVDANTDSLTGLPNRRAFLDTLGREIRRSQRHTHPLSLAMIDVDEFKEVNDTYGHDAGDKVLQSLAQLFVKEFRDYDLVGRLGGEEFAVIFPDTKMSGANVSCERLLDKVRRARTTVNSEQIYCTVSIGLTELQSDTRDTTALLKRADQLMYEAKVDGRNRVILDPLITSR